MTYFRHAILAIALIAGLIPAIAPAQVPPVVPPLPDTERRTTYTISGTTCACAVNFALYGDSTDFQNWVEVFINGTRINYNDATRGWTITSPTGPLGLIPRPVTNAVLTFASPQTGTVQIVGARRPRRVAQFPENRGVAARDFNQALTDLVAQNREVWDKTNDVTGRAILAPPGETLNLLAAAATRASTTLGFDALGQIAFYSPASAVTSSGNVTFLQSGTGAVSRTVQAELRDAVKAAQFGMVCDGVTDDSPALQRAVTESDARGGVPVVLPKGTCPLNSNVFLNKWSPGPGGPLTVPGLNLVGQGKGVTVLDTRVANGYAISVNPAWKAAHQALAGITAASGGSGALATNTYYVQITMNDALVSANEVYVTIPKSIAVTGPTGRISITLPPTNAGYSYNLHCSTSSTPANYCIVGGNNAVALGGGQTVFLDAIGSARTVPTNKQAIWQQANISDLSITNSTGAANASGVMYFKTGYSNITNVYMGGLTGNGFDIPNYSGDIDGSFVTTVDKSKFDTIAGWCINAAGNVLELSNFTVTNSVMNLCGTLPSGYQVNRTITSITNAATPVVTTSVAHGWLANDQIYISGVTGMTLAAGWYRVGTVLSTTTFNLKDLNGILIDTTALGAYTASSGAGKLSWRPPTLTSGSGGIAWMGLIGTFKNNGFTQNNNVAMYFTEGGTSDNATIENTDYENTEGKGLYVGGLVGGSINNSECLSKVGLGSTISCIQLGTGFAAGIVTNFKLSNIKVRTDVTPTVAFEQFPNAAIPGAYVDTNRVNGVYYQSFDAPGQTRFVGFKFDGITGQAKFSISALNTALLSGVGYGFAMPMQPMANGEWVEYQVPFSGITRTGIGGLTPSTAYYFYLYNSAGPGLPYIGAIEVSATAPVSADPGGYYVKSGDTTRTYIGSATTDGSGNFQAGGTQSSQYPSGGGALVGTGATNSIAYYSAPSVIVGLATANNGVLVTSAGGVPSISTTLPNGLALGTPASGTLTNATGLPISTGVSGLGASVATFLATPSSANLRAALTDEVGSGSAYFVGGALGTPASGTATNLTGLPLTTGVTGTLPVANGGTGDTGTAWSTYTPTITAGSGTITTSAATGRYKILGKTVFLQVDLNITTAGTGAGQLRASLPPAAGTSVSGPNYVGNALEYNLGGKSGSARVPSGGTVMQALDATGATFIANSAFVVMECIYEIP